MSGAATAGRTVLDLVDHLRVFRQSRRPRTSPVRPAGQQPPRVIELGVVAATAAILPGLVFALWLSGWYDNVPSSLAMHDPAGEAQGRVWKVEPSTSTIYVSPRIFGVGAVPVRLSEDTRILVGDKEGGFGDLHEGVRVNIVYERRPASLVASCVELLGRQATASTAPPSGACRSTGPVAQQADRRFE
jgi:hypothetical protein